jgi:ParB family chromosome partitioning protein
MSKRDDLMRLAAAHIDESVGSAGPAGSAPLATSSAPARWQGVTKSKSAVEIPLEKIERDPTQPREEFDPDALNRLAESLKTRGLLQPIRVRWSEEQGMYIVLAGERRWRASRLAGLTTITAVVIDREPDPGERLALQLIENCLREDLRPIEQARAYRRLMELNGWSGNQLAKELAIAQGTVSRSLSLLDLPAEIQERVERGELAPSIAQEVARLDDATIQAEIAERVVTEKLTRGEVAEVVRAHRAGSTDPTAGSNPSTAGRATSTRSERLEIRLKDGTKLTLSGPAVANGPEAIAAALRQAARQVLAETRDDSKGQAA